MQKKIKPGERYVIPMHGDSVVEVESVDAAFVKFFVVKGPELYKIVPLFVPLKQTKRWKKIRTDVEVSDGPVRIKLQKFLKRLLGRGK